MELSKEEQEIILKFRAEKESKIRFIHVLRIAYKFAEWMEEVGAGETYSTFCDDFGYKAIKGEDRPKFYNNILKVIDFAKSL